nr:hypothetical protein [Sphingomonas panni]
MRLGAYLALTVAAAMAATSAQARDGSVLIRGARVFDGTRMLGVRDVLVRDGRIVAVARRVAAPSGIELIEARGRVLIPGLIDGHVHVFPGAQADALRFGVTTVFDMYSLADRATIDHWRQQRTSFAQVGEADTFTAGIGATPPGGHPLELFSDMPTGTALPQTLAPGENPASFMTARIDAGSDYIKVLQDDGARQDRPASLPAFSPQRFAVVLTAAKATGKRVGVHVQQLADARIAVMNGANALEHAVCDVPIDDALGGVDKFEPVSCGGEVDHAEEAAGQLVVTCGDGAVDLEVAEHALDAVSLLVERPVMLDLDPPV